MKKKIFAIVLALVLVFSMLTFVGCGKDFDEEFFSLDKTMQLTLKDDNYTLVKKTVYGYFEESFVTSGNFIEHGKFIEFLPSVGKTKTKFFNKSTSEKTAIQNTFFGERSSENGLVVSLENLNSFEGSEPLFKDDLETGIYSRNVVEYGAICDVYVPKNCSVEELALNLAYTLKVITPYGYSDPVRSVDAEDIQGFDSSVTGSQTVKIDIDGTQYDIVVFVDENQNNLLNNHQLKTTHILTSTVELGTTANEWLETSEQLNLDHWSGHDPLSFYAFVDGKKVEFGKDDVSVENWKADTANDTISFVAKITAEKDGEQFFTFANVRAFDDDFNYTIITQYNPPVRYHIGHDSPNMGVSKYDFNFLAIDKSKNMQIDINTIKPVESLWPSDGTNISSTPGQISDLINLNKTGAQILTLNEDTPFEQDFFIYVYDQNTTVASDYLYMPMTFDIPVVNGELVFDSASCTNPLQIAMDGSYVGSVDKSKLTIEYSKDELAIHGYAHVVMSFKVKVDGKEYTFKYNTFARSY